MRSAPTMNVLIDYPLFMSYSDRIETALQIARPLVELSPGWGHVMVTIILMLDNDFEAALMMAREGILFIPSHTLARAYFGILEVINGNVELALENLRIAERLSQSSFTAPTVLVALAEGYGIIGQHDDARRILVRIQAMGERYTVGAACLGLAYLATGDEDNALEWLRQAADDKRPDEAVLAQSFVRANIYADPVLERPEFIAVRERLGFESL
jgi:tetratricopeptide (TPR) repeat protein